MEGDATPVKLILLGDSAVGKSKLVERYLMDDFHPQQLSTYALTLFQHEAVLSDGTKVPLNIWDTAGQEVFSNMHPAYYDKAHVCILAFDVTRKSTYKNLTKWHKELTDHRPDIPIIVVANKVDTDYSVTSKSYNFATKRNLPFHFVSAADGTNVVKVFTEAVKLGKKFQEHAPKNFVADVMDLLDTIDDELAE
eukprot:TRINITY_DN8930_c0_g1_i1.p1 TRINITY_DN8930_c0_g1~~TRINITY_DN8930_c0_g1_i1.p1  ORF type:complete len:194 (+),score=38.28 TRINITY_DN8930_c0_g1_i1:168-749(+)